MTAPLPAADVPLPPVAARFCRYVQIDTTSDPDAASTPSTARQKDLARLLEAELRALGLDAEMAETGVVYATFPAPVPSGAPPLGLVAHVDTSPDAPGAGVRPLVHARYAGGRVALPGAPDLELSPATSPALAEAVGHDLITSDGTTLLGSDDKAGVAVIVELVAELARAEADAAARGERPAPRPELRILFTPDEEIGRGTDAVDLERFGAAVAYTLDGAGVDVLNVETFSAAEARLTVEGVGVHPGYAYGLLVNALRIASAFALALPADEAPETTRGRAGYYHPHTLSGTAERAELRVLLRDFDDDGLARRKAVVEALAERTQADHPGATVALAVTDSYRNMRRAIEATEPRAITVAHQAAEAIGIRLREEPVRGGTDGARLSALGIPTPNVFTGGHAFHSRREWNTVQNLERCLAYTRALVHAWGRQPAA